MRRIINASPYLAFCVPYYGNNVMSSPLLGLLRRVATTTITTTITCGFLLVGVGVAIILASSVFTMLPVLPNQYAYGGTFPGPNGQIAFASERDDNPEGGNLEIYAMNADGSELTRLTDNDVHDQYPSWSPDGTKIAFARDNGSGFSEIYAMNADGSELTRLTKTVANDPFFHHSGDIHPSWSPDGTKIAFVSYREANTTSFNPEIYVMNADGTGLTRLTNEFEYDASPSWSPDGTKIAFVSYRDNPGGQNGDIYIMNADDGSDVTRLTNHNTFNADPSWSPDGTKIAFTHGGEIYVMNADDGSELTRLTRNAVDDHSPSWSPDGTKIAFTHGGNDASQFEIYVMNADDGSNETRLTNNDAFDVTPDWGTNTSPAGGGGNGDTISPVITVPENIVVEATSEQVAQVTFTVTAQDDVDGTATLEEDGTTITQDNVGGDIIIACSPASYSIFPLGDSLVQCSARDAAGNFVRASFTVTVNSQPPPPDTTRPIITIPEDMTVEATGPEGTTVSFEVSAVDDEDGPTDVECDHNSGETFPIGETIVTCSAEDLAGNRADEKSFTITVQDTTAPDVEITEASDRRNGRAISDGSTTNMRYIEITFEATDAVGIDNTECSLDGAAFTSCTSPVVYDRLSRSTHQFTVRSTDAAGNTGEDQFTWTVNNPSAAAPGRQ